MRMVLVLATTFLLLMSCGGYNGEEVPGAAATQDARVCELCGRAHPENPHSGSAPEPERSSVEPQNVGSAEIMAYIEKQRTSFPQTSTFICPGLLGGLPTRESLRVHAPVLNESSNESISWTWFVTSATPIHLMVGPGMSVGVAPDRAVNPAPRTGNYVGRISVSLKKIAGEFADLCTVEVKAGSLGGGGGTTLNHVPMASGTELSDLFIVNKATMAIELGEGAILAGVDGRCVRLSFRKEGEWEIGKELSASLEWLVERIYSGEPGTQEWLEGNSRVSEPELVSIKNKSVASQRALAFLSREANFSELKPIRVTKTNLGHYRVEFSPSASGTSTFVVVNAKDGRVGFSRHPRQCLNVGR